MRIFVFASISLMICCLYSCESHKTHEGLEYIDLSKLRDGIHHWELYSKIRTTQRLDSSDIIGIADNLIAYQNTDGGWPKNIDWLAVIDVDSVINALDERYRGSTFDNRNTYPQIEYLSEVYFQTGIDKYRAAAEKGFQYILETEYPRGGWRGWDADVITFNDDVMTGITNLLLDVKTGEHRYGWIDDALRQKLNEAYTRGLEVILKCQVKIAGELTAWCQQHDANTYEPVRGRLYEHPSVTARESSEVVLFLMRIPAPDRAVQKAIEAAVQWFDDSKITGYRYSKIAIDPRPFHESIIDYDRVLVPDSTAPALWARFYDLERGEPFLSLVDGAIVYSLSEISFDRRVGYEWYGYWPEAMFEAFGK